MKRKRTAAAAEPWLVTHGLTLRGAQLSWAILNGDKRVENPMDQPCYVHVHVVPCCAYVLVTCGVGA